MVNLLAAVVLVCLIIVLFFLSLGWITNHGSYLKVPSVTGLDLESAKRQLESEGFEVVVTDSSYTDSLDLNVVKKQLPLSGATVKVNRTVFLHVNPKELPMISMPKLEGLSYRFAVDYLKKNNLHLGDTTEKPDFMKGSVLEQLYEGRPINPGDKVRWGSKIDLVIGGGIQQVHIPVPDLVGMRVDEARVMLEVNGILLASIIGSGLIQDTANAYVYKQNPEVRDFQDNRLYIQPGQTMDIWIQVEKPVVDSIMLRPEREHEPSRVTNPSDY